jgi:mRNA-degrading endonuclease YafQ of YafQ-DinJ toxin-antitoxin module
MRKIVVSNQFEKKLLKFLSKNPDLKIKVASVFSLLEKDVNHLSLKTHKLRGGLSLLYSCSILY